MTQYLQQGVRLTVPSELTVNGGSSSGSGSLTLDLAPQGPNLVLSGPTAGPAARADFRYLVPADIPALPYVTSVAVALPAPLGVSGSPITSSGTVTCTWAGTGYGNRVLATPDGVAGDPSFRTLMPTDIPNLDITKVNSGILPLGQGGTGLSTSAVTDGQLLIGQSSDHSFGLATLTAGPGISITNAGHAITITNTNASAAGTVTSVGLALPSIFSVSGSPVTTSGTLSATLATESANLVLAGPTAGVAAAPTFRSLVPADIPGLAASAITTGVLGPARGGTGVDASTAANGQLLIGTGTGLALGTLTAGSNVTITNTAGAITIGAAGSGGTVTSVGLSLPTELFTITNSPVTTSGTLSAGFNAHLHNTVLAGPPGVLDPSAAPTFRALTSDDLPLFDASKINTGHIGITQGGTGMDASAVTDGQLLIGQSSPHGFQLATLTAGSGVTITNGSGAITVAVPRAITDGGLLHAYGACT